MRRAQETWTDCLPKPLGEPKHKRSPRLYSTDHLGCLLSGSMILINYLGVSMLPGIPRTVGTCRNLPTPGTIQFARLCHAGSVAEAPGYTEDEFSDSSCHLSASRPSEIGLPKSETYHAGTRRLSPAPDSSVGPLLSYRLHRAMAAARCACVRILPRISLCYPSVGTS